MGSELYHTKIQKNTLPSKTNVKWATLLPFIAMLFVSVGIGDFSGLAHVVFQVLRVHGIGLCAAVISVKMSTLKRTFMNGKNLILRQKFYDVRLS